MRTSAIISTVVATLCVVSGNFHTEIDPVTRALAQSQSPGSSSNDTASLEALQKYLGNGTKVENLSPEETKKLLEKLNEDAKTDTSLKAILVSLKLDAETIGKYTEKTFKSISNTLTTFFSGSILPVQVDGSKEEDEGVFSNVWNSLFGKKKKKEDSTPQPTRGGSGSGSGGLEESVGSDDGSGSEAAAVTAPDDTSIETAAPQPTTKPVTAKPAVSGSRAQLLTSVPVAGIVAAMVVINFWQ